MCTENDLFYRKSCFAFTILHANFSVLAAFPPLLFAFCSIRGWVSSGLSTGLRYPHSSLLGVLFSGGEERGHLSRGLARKTLPVGEASPPFKPRMPKG